MDYPASPLVCAHCGRPLADGATVDIMVEPDAYGARLSAASDRGHHALLATLEDVVIAVDGNDVVGQFIDAFNGRGLVCAWDRRALTVRGTVNAELPAARPCGHATAWSADDE